MGMRMILITNLEAKCHYQPAVPKITDLANTPFLTKHLVNYV